MAETFNNQMRGNIESSTEAEILRRLESKEEFIFEIKHNKEVFFRNNLLLILFSTLIFGGLGVIIFYVLQFENTGKQAIVIGICASLGVFVGIIVSSILLLAIKLKLVEDYEGGYGQGIGTNAFIGAIVGVFFGAIVGPLFGLILMALNYFIDTQLSYPLYLLMFWIILGLNIGVLIGLITSFGIINIVAGGFISGIIVGGIGTLAIFGPDLIIAGGALAGGVIGVFIGIFVKYSIEASLGYYNVPKGCSGCINEDKHEQRMMREPEDPRKKRKQTSSSSCNGDCGNCDCPSDCGSADCGEAAVPVILVVLIAIPVIIIIGGLSWMGTKASTRLGQNVKKGGITVLGAGLSISTIIGSNIGLTAAYHELELSEMVIIGVVLGFTFGLIIFLANWFSVSKSELKITPNRIIWKDRHTKGSILFSKIEKSTFTIPSETGDDYFEFDSDDGRGHKVLIDCWKTGYNAPSSSVIRFILDFYLERYREYFAQTMSERTDHLGDKISSTRDLPAQTYDKYPTRSVRVIGDVEEYLDETPKDSKLPSYSFATDDFNEETAFPELEIKEEDVQRVNDLIRNKKNIRLDWICTITGLPYEVVDFIVTKRLNRIVKEGKIIR